MTFEERQLVKQAISDVKREKLRHGARESQHTRTDWKRYVAKHGHAAIAAKARLKNHRNKIEQGFIALDDEIETTRYQCGSCLYVSKHQSAWRHYVGCVKLGNGRGAPRPLKTP